MSNMSNMGDMCMISITGMISIVGIMSIMNSMSMDIIMGIDIIMSMGIAGIMYSKGTCFKLGMYQQYNHLYVSVQMQGQLLSDLLNEQKICELFHEEGSPENKKQEISLNFTVTSREHDDPAPLKQDLTSTSFLDQAKASLSQFEGWCNRRLDQENKQILDRMHDLNQFTQKKKPNLLSVPSFPLRAQRAREKECGGCQRREREILEKDELISRLQAQLQTQGLREELLNGVEARLLAESNCELRLVNEQLKEEVEKARLEKSSLFDKTKDLEKRLGCMQKSFSNAKNSTNPTNNDTLNRDSIISFEHSEPNLEEEVKYLERLREKYLGLVNEDAKERLEEKSCCSLSKEEQMNLRKSSSFYPIYAQYRAIVDKLKGLRKSKEQSLDFRQLSEGNDSKTYEKGIKMKVVSLENSNHNLKTANNELKALLENCVKKNKLLEDQLERALEEAQEKHKKTKLTFKKAILEEKARVKHLYEELLRKEREALELAKEAEDLKGPLRLFCRLKPRTGSEAKLPPLIEGSPFSISKDQKKYDFHRVFLEKSTQEDVFNEVRRLLELSLHGRNLCFLAYGQSGSGKTYTLHGTESEGGLAPSIVSYLFDVMEGRGESEGMSIAMGMVGIYLDNVVDLFGIVPLGTKIEIREDKHSGVYLENCPLITFSSREQMLRVYGEGIEKRKKFSLEAKDELRSHCITIISIARQDQLTKERLHSKITFVDLAPSQKSHSTRENNFVGHSLSSLRHVLSGVSSHRAVHYKNSKLTYLLKDSLNPRAKIVLFLNLSQAPAHEQEVERSLEFARQVREEAQEEMEMEMPKKTSEKSRRGSSKVSVP